MPAGASLNQYSSVTKSVAVNFLIINGWSARLRLMLFEKGKFIINKYWPELSTFESYEILYINFNVWVTVGTVKTCFIYVTQYED